MWIPIRGYEGFYEISNFGAVRSLDRMIPSKKGKNRLAKGIILKQTKDSDGYIIATLYQEGNYKKFKVHRLMLENFIGACPEGMQCRHLDGNNTNNSLQNLRWGTVSENNLDRVRHGTHQESIKTHCPKGHEYSGNNVKIYRNKRRCVSCSRNKNSKLGV